MDSNKDGVVDLAEFAAADGAKQEFSWCDRNGDGVLDGDEMALRSTAKQKIAAPADDGDQGDPVGDELEAMAEEFESMANAKHQAGINASVLPELEKSNATSRALQAKVTLLAV